MEQLKEYLTKEGWNNDWNQTKQDFSKLYHNSGLEQLTNSQTGSSVVEVSALVVGSAVAMGVGAVAGSYIGGGLGYVWGSIVDFVPLVNDVAPWLAERTGLVEDAKSIVDLNENLYQTTGAVSGFWGGLWLLPKVVIKGLTSR
jgi:hypothetical protein